MTSEDRQRIGAQLRELAGLVASDDLDGAAWAEVSELLAAATARFPEPRAAETRFARSDLEASNHPIAEGSSGVYPTLDLREDDGVLTAETRFGPAWEGPPGLVHGGFLAAGFDMVLSAAAHRVLSHSVTRRLQLRYLRPTYTGALLRYEVRAGARDGRLLELHGTLHCDDVLTMRASAQFASLDRTRFADRRSG